MRILITSMVILSVVSVAAGQIIRNLRRKVFIDRKTWVSAAVLLSLALTILSLMLASGRNLSLYVLAMDMMPSVVGMWLLSSFMEEEDFVKRSLSYVLLTNPMLAVYNLCVKYGITGFPSDRLAVIVSSLMIAVLILLLLYGIRERMWRVKELMKCGTVWAIVCLNVDVVYVCFVIAAMALVQLDCAEAGVFLLGGVLSAIGLRIMTDLKFLLWRDQETLIAESMKLSSLSSAADATRIDEIYKELYGRILTYFDAKRPFLDSELTINDLVKDLYSNKLYISRAISQYTGRNFCQFVNYYRVMHSVSSFRDNPDMKIRELADMSGFNSVVSFNMAFRLFMGVNPSEWCRKERARLQKSEKAARRRTK